MMCLAGEKSDLTKSTDPYHQIAIEISTRISQFENKRIAVVPFSYADSSSSLKDGSIISERIMMALIKTGKVEVVERSALDKVIAELKLENSGVVDLAFSKELGRVLGASYILSGTLVRVADNFIEVNGRLIEVESAKSVFAFQKKIFKDWINQKQKNDSDRNIRRRRFEKAPAGD